MVQVLPANPRKGPSFLESLGAGMGQAIPGAVESYFQNKNQQQQLQQQMQQMAQENQQLQKMGIDLSGITDPKMRQAAFAEAVKGQRKKGEFEDISNMLKSSSSSKKTMSDQLQGQESETQPMEQEFDYANIPDDTITAINVLNPAAGRDLRHAKDVALREKTEERKMEHSEKMANRKALAPVLTQLMERGNSARQAIQTKEKLIEKVDTGNLDDPTFVAIADLLPFNLGKRMLSDDTAEYKSAMVDDFQGLTNTFPGQIRVKELEIWEDKLANVYLTDSQKKAILKNRINSLQSDVIRMEAAEDIAMKNPDLTPIEFNKKLNQEMNKRTSALAEITKNDINNVLNQAEARKKMPLNPSDPEDKKIMQQILKEAGNSKEKAKELAKKKGYSW